MLVIPEPVPLNTCSEGKKNRTNFKTPRNELRQMYRILTERITQIFSEAVINKISARRLCAHSADRERINRKGGLLINTGNEAQLQW